MNPISKDIQVGDVFIKQFFIVCFQPHGIKGMFIVGGPDGVHAVIGGDRPKVMPMIGTDEEVAKEQFKIVSEHANHHLPGHGKLMLVKLTEGKVMQMMDTKDSPDQKEFTA